MDTDKTIKLLKKGDCGAQLEIIDTYQDYVYTIAFRILKIETMVEEAVQDVFIKIFKNIGQYKGDAKLSTWIYTITYRTCLNIVSSNKWQKNITSLDENDESLTSDALEQPNQFNSSEESDVKNILWDAIDRLNQPQGIVITLFYLQCFSINEIASLMEIAENTVKTHLFRGRKRLREILLQTYEIEEFL